MVSTKNRWHLCCVAHFYCRKYSIQQTLRFYQESYLFCTKKYQSKNGLHPPNPLPSPPGWKGQIG